MTLQVHAVLFLTAQSTIYASERREVLEPRPEVQNCNEFTSSCSGLVARVLPESDLSASLSLIQRKGEPVEIFHGPGKLATNSKDRSQQEPSEPLLDEGARQEREEKLKGLAKAMHENWMNISEAAGTLDDETQARLIYAVKHHMVNAMSWPKAYYQYAMDKHGPLASSNLPQLSALQSVMVATGEVICNTSNDILVLMPLFLGRDKVKLAGMYMVIKMIISFLLSWTVSPWRANAPISYTITAKAFSIILPAAVSLKFFFEWYSTPDEEDEDGERQPRPSGLAAGAANESQSSSAPESSKGPEAWLPLLARLLSALSAAIPSSRQCTRYWILLQLCLATNFDKFGLFAHLTELQMTYLELLFGHLIASLLIALTLLGLSQLWMIKFTFSRIPLWFMLLLITMYALTCQLYLLFINSMAMAAS
mmetsp:Transcript_82082/g.145494  ORF Transcript_82082/g.145494 Transcript_82082/m.145494 type:complete len:423 (-) Transcript_82082:97-1365(-)